MMTLCAPAVNPPAPRHRPKVSFPFCVYTFWGVVVKPVHLKYSSCSHDPQIGTGLNYEHQLFQEAFCCHTGSINANHLCAYQLTLKQSFKNMARILKAALPQIKVWN